MTTQVTAYRRLHRVLASLMRCQSGATAIEYGLLCGTLAAAMLTALSAGQVEFLRLFNAIAEIITSVP